MVNNDYAPQPRCDCAVCSFFNDRVEARRRQDEDLEANYQRYLAGELVSKDAKE